jgi:hypothetical protein
MHAWIHAYLTLNFYLSFALIIFLVIIIIREGKYEISVLVFNGIETE